MSGDGRPEQQVIEYDGILLAEVWNLPSAVDCFKWEATMRTEATRRGYEHQRFHHHPTEPGHLLLEGRRFPTEDWGEPRWFGGA